MKPRGTTILHAYDPMHAAEGRTALRLSATVRSLLPAATADVEAEIRRRRQTHMQRFCARCQVPLDLQAKGIYCRACVASRRRAERHVADVQLGPRDA